MGGIEFGIYAASVLLFSCYVMQLRAIIFCSRKTRISKDKTEYLYEYVFGAKRKTTSAWPYLAITIIFPLIISIIPLLLIEFPDLKYINSDGTVIFHNGELMEILSAFISNLLIVLVTLEFSLLFGIDLPEKCKKWRDLLMVASCLDVVMFLMISIFNSKIGENSDVFLNISVLSIIFIFICALFSFIATTSVVFSIYLLGNSPKTYTEVEV